MSKSLECANLVLDSGYLTMVQGSTIPTVQTFQINLKKALGDMYDKYDTFAICLNSVVNYAQLSTYSTGDPDVASLGGSSVVKVGMTGLNWMSTTLNGQKQSLVLFPNAFVIGGNSAASDGGYGSGNFKKPNCVMFKKPATPNITLTVGFYIVRKNLAIRLGNSSGEVRFEGNYNFSIFGIEEE